MAIWMWVLIFVIISQRLIELVIAKNNEKWMKERGGIEHGEGHYKWFIMIHTLFFISLIIESTMNNRIDFTLNYTLFFIFIITQLGRIWCILTLGRFWNTKIIILPNVTLIRNGPYKYVKHPNYIIVGVELIIIPLLFGTYITAIIFPVLHYILLRIRIPKENAALESVTLN